MRTKMMLVILNDYIELPASLLEAWRQVGIKKIVALEEKDESTEEVEKEGATR